MYHPQLGIRGQKFQWIVMEEVPWLNSPSLSLSGTNGILTSKVGHRKWNKCTWTRLFVTRSRRYKRQKNQMPFLINDMPKPKSISMILVPDNYSVINIYYLILFFKMFIKRILVLVQFREVRRVNFTCYMKYIILTSNWKVKFI